MPILTATTFNTDTDDVLNAAARTRYTQVVVGIISIYLAAGRPPARMRRTIPRLADSIRSRSVQKARLRQALA